MKCKPIWQQSLVSLLLCASFTSVSQATIDNIGSASDYYGYPVITESHEDMISQLGERFGGTVLASFALSQDLLYVVVEVEQGQESHIVSQSQKDGKPSYSIVSSAQGNMPLEILLAQREQVENSPNIALDFSLLPLFTKEEGFVSYLHDALQDVEGSDLNPQAKGQIAQYIQTVLQQMGTVQGYAETNILVVEGEAFQSAIERQNQQESAFLALLEEENISLNQSITKNIQMVVQQMDKTIPMQVSLDRSVLMALQPGMNLHIQVAETALSLTISQEMLVEYWKDQDYFTVIWGNLGENNEAIHFFNGQGEKIDKLSAPLTLTLPANSPYERVEAHYSWGQEQWGGQWDEKNSAVSFATSYSGEYTLVDGIQTITDLEKSTENQVEAIEFMLSKGFFQVEEGRFYPTAPLSRYDFAFALVGMFYGLDRDLNLDFDDVSRDSFYYAYVSSGQAGNLLPEWEENQYQGGESLSQEQVFSIIARLLVEEKGYFYPTDPSAHLEVIGAEKASDWAELSIALCYHGGIILRGEVINPQDDITRAQAATYLNRLFDLVYEPSPVSTYYHEALPPVSQDAEKIALFTAAVFGAWALAFGIVATLDHGLRKAHWKRKQQKKAKKAEKKAQASETKGGAV